MLAFGILLFFYYEFDAIFFPNELFLSFYAGFKREFKLEKEFYFALY